MSHTTQPPPHSVQPARLAFLAAIERTAQNDEISEAALNVARFLSIVAQYDGGIQIEWHTNGQDVELEIGPDGWLRTVSIERAADPEPVDDSTIGDVMAELARTGFYSDPFGAAEDES